jgi:hypothetical protein
MVSPHGIVEVIKGKIEIAAIYLSGFFYESATDGITAHAGGLQTNAVALTTEVNRVSIVATAGDSVALPPSVAGLTIMVINAAANSMQVFGTSPDTINGVATGTGVTQMGNSVCFYACSAAGAWYSEGLGTGYSGSLMTESAADALTAHPGGGQTSALQLTAAINRVTTVATVADSVKLMATAPGLSIVVINAASNAVQVFGTSPDTINGVATGTGVSLAAGKTATFFCTVAGAWHQQLSA